MAKKDAAPAAREQGAHYSLDVLLALAPDEPLVELDPLDRQYLTHAEFLHWLIKAKSRRRKFPGYQADYRFREQMKYGRLPPEDAPLNAQVRQLLHHAKAKWSGEVGAQRTNKQFRDWVPDYLENDQMCWRIGQLAEAEQVLRLACGLPRFAPTRRTAR